ncbi:MAG: hypothetical protein GJ680_18730 [Alteromonadaceae bacterium]|nr:hypothetical protein [Alteromonadaceae bacterium]
MIRPIGAWSDETAARFVNEINKNLERENVDFAGLIDLRQWELGTPKALEIIGKNLFYAASLGYKMEIHFGEPKAIPMQISKEKITPPDVTLLQSQSLEEISDRFKKAGYRFETTALQQFLENL